MPFCSFSEGAAMFDVTPIENMFLLEYLPDAPGDALRVYLYARMLCLHPELGTEIGDVAKALNMDEDDVQEAFLYWERNGLVEKLSDRPPTYAIRMLHSESFHSQQNRELIRYKELRALVNKMFEERGLVHEKQFQLLIDWIDDLHYTETAALKLLEFEMNQPGGKKPPAVFKRADKRAIEWSEKGIRTVEEVEVAIRFEGRISDMASLVMTQLSLFRAPTMKELECVRRWIEELGVSERDVLDACEETTKSRSPSFAYIDSILQKRKMQAENAYFQAVKDVLDKLGAVGMKPTDKLMGTYQSWLEQGFEAQTVQLAAEQCAQKGMNTFEKLEWMLRKWENAGVRSHEQAQLYLAERQRVKAEAAELLHRAGLSGEPGQSALSYYEKWKAHYSAALINYAAELAQGKPHVLNYINKLLTEWEKSGVTTPEAARAQHAQVAGAAREAAKSSAPVNFQQRSYTQEESQSVYFDLEKYYAEEDEGK